MGSDEGVISDTTKRVKLTPSKRSRKGSKAKSKFSKSRVNSDDEDDSAWESLYPRHGEKTIP